MKPRRPQPGKSLQDIAPDVAAIWHPELNGELTPADVLPKSQFLAWWRCPNGHEWQERIAARMTFASWKNLQLAACRQCEGLTWEVTFACGHTKHGHGTFGGDSTRSCYSCLHREWRVKRDELLPKLRSRAEELLGEFWEEEQLDAFIPSVIRKVVVPPMLDTITEGLVQNVFWGKAGSTEQALNSAVSELARLVSETAINDAIARQKPVAAFGKAHWPQGLLYNFGRRNYWDPSTDDTDLVADLTAAAEAAIRHTPVSTAEGTRALTDALKEWAYARGWPSYRELSLLLPQQRRYGRFDLVVIRGAGLPDIVIEIDSKNEADTIPKLAIASEMGATTIWIRWSGGALTSVQGVVTVDLRTQQSKLREIAGHPTCLN